MITRKKDKDPKDDEDEPFVPSSIEDVSKFLQSSISEVVENEDGSKQIIITYTNTGDADLHFTNDVEHEPDDEFLIVTKTTGQPAWSLITNSQDAPDTSVYTAHLGDESQKEVRVPPGQTITRTLDIPAFLSGEPVQVSLVIKTVTEIVEENGVEFEKISPIGSTVIQEPGFVSVYIVIYAQQNVLQVAQQKNAITADVIGLDTSKQIRKNPNSDEFYLEISINHDTNKRELSAQVPGKHSVLKWILNKVRSKRTVFSELYGPFDVKKGEGHVLGQQLGFDETKFQGQDLTLNTKLIKNGVVIDETDRKI